jgi:hypothetical protein
LQNSAVDGVQRGILETKVLHSRCHLFAGKLQYLPLDRYSISGNPPSV